MNEEVAYFKKFMDAFLEGGMKRLKDVIDLEIQRGMKFIKIDVSIEQAYQIYH